MKRHIKRLFLSFVIIVLTFFTTSCFKVNQTTVQFINSSNTDKWYNLLDDNVNPNAIYHDLIELELENGYQFSTIDGSVRYVFTTIDEYGDEPVMAYFRYNKNNEISGKLLGINIGDPTKVYQNTTLKIDKTYSLFDYLKDNGFEINYDFIVKYPAFDSEANVFWCYYTKDNVFVNFALEDSKSLNLFAYEIGIIDDNVFNLLKKDKEGYTFKIEDGSYIPIDDYKESYIPGELITIRVGKPSLEGKLKLYINDEHVSDLILIDDYYVTKFYMPTYDVDLKIVLEN